jgi:hypothetical protein
MEFRRWTLGFGSGESWAEIIGHFNHSSRCHILGINSGVQTELRTLGLQYRRCLLRQVRRKLARDKRPDSIIQRLEYSTKLRLVLLLGCIHSLI